MVLILVLKSTTSQRNTTCIKFVIKFIHLLNNNQDGFGMLFFNSPACIYAGYDPATLVIKSIPFDLKGS